MSQQWSTMYFIAIEEYYKAKVLIHLEEVKSKDTETENPEFGHQKCYFYHTVAPMLW